MTRKLRSRIPSRVALASAAALIMTISLTAALSATGQRVDAEPNSDSVIEVYGPFGPQRTVEARDLPATRQWLPGQPPAATGHMGSRHRVHAINGLSGAGIAVYDTTNGDLTATFDLGDLGSGNCAFGAGDAVVFHDRQADRWLMSESSRTASTVCIYISQTPDPAGAYFGYEIVAPRFPARPKYEIRANAYQVVGNQGADAVYALERTRMLAGEPVTAERLAIPGRAVSGPRSGSSGFALGLADPPEFTKSFSPATIGPGSTTTLTFLIDNAGQPAATSLAFSDTLPAGMTIATPASASTDCTDAILSAPDGGTTISFSNGRVGSGASCTVTVNVTSSTPGMSVNTSGDLTSSAGNSGTAMATLTVDSTLPGFSKVFSPSSINLGATSTLTLTIDNSSVGAVDQENSLTFTDFLPAGMVVASPPNASTDCSHPSVPATLTAVSGTNIVRHVANGSGFFVLLAAGGTCTVTVDVTTESYGVFDNVSGGLDAGTDAGFATATLDVPRNPLAKSFIDDPVLPGGTVNLEFTIQNFDRANAITGIAFTDDLEAMLSGLEPASGETPKAACGGTLDFAAGVLSLTGGSLPAEGSCTFTVLLEVPAGAATGTYPNITTPLEATVAGNTMFLNEATDDLFVQTPPLLTKEFVGDPVAPGDDVILRFTISNTSTTSSATDIAFDDELTTFFPYPVSVVLPGPDPCGAGSSLTLVSFGTEREGLSFTGGSLDPAPGAGSTCTFDVILTVPSDIPTNTYVNTTSPITATVDGVTVAGDPATDSFDVVAAPSLRKEFTDDPVLPGETVTLEFTLSLDEEAHEATGVGFTDDLAAVVSGLTATGLPLVDLCGIGNGTLTGSAGDTLLTFSGATLQPGEVCTFSVTLQVSASATPGSYTNTTSPVSATVNGLTTSGNPASDDLEIATLTFTKEFIDDPVRPGGTVTLRFTIDNNSPTDDASAIFFTDSLATMLPGTLAVALPMAPCGGSFSGTNFLIFSGGSVLAGESCSFDVTLSVPAGATPDAYRNLTSSLTATTVGGAQVVAPATDLLVVEGRLLMLTKEFTDDPVLPGGAVNLQFTLTNLDATQAASVIAFTDDLDAALSGLVATGLPVPACGGTVSGTSTISFTGGSLPAGGTCSFNVSVAVPAGATPGSVATNTTSPVSGLIGGLPSSGDPASDNLTIANTVSFTKSFGDPVPAGGIAVLEFTIENLSATTSLADLSFTDNLDDVIVGLEATGLPKSDVCGAGSQLAALRNATNQALIQLSGGNLAPSESCTFSVLLRVPASTAAGSYLNTTSELREGSDPVALPATATLEVEVAPPLAARMETGTVAVDGTYTTVTLAQPYVSPVVVATVHVVNNTSPVVTRVRQVTGNSFQVKLQNPSGATPVTDNVSYWVVEEGVHAFDGIKIEAATYVSTQISRKGAFNPESRTYGQAYATPVVLGQVMTENDARWSSFFAVGNSLTNPPTATSLKTGRQIGEDTDHVRADETIGYIVIEAVHTTLAGVELEVALGSDTVKGVGDGPPFTYSFNSSFATAPTGAVMSVAGVDGGNGPWAEGFGTPLATTNSLFLAVDEDQIGDVERSHTTEQVAYAAFAGELLFPPACTVDMDCDDGTFCNGAETCDAGSCLPGVDPCPGSTCDETADTCITGVTPKLESIMTVAGGFAKAPTTVTMTNTYVSPVIACVPVYASINVPPIVVRLDNVTGSSFDVYLQNPGDIAAVPSATVHCLVVEEGSWIIDGHPVEAVRYTSTITDKKGSYLGAAQTLTHAFANPVVLGQVMSRNDSRWSVYWQQGVSQYDPPSAMALRNGKMVGEDPDATRADEVIGFIVFEQSNGTLGGVHFEAALGPDIVEGVGAPITYSFNSTFAVPPIAVATQAGMDGGNGSFAYLFGSVFATTTTLSLSVDEDNIGDAERIHNTEQVGYVAFETPVVFP